ncbi:MAG: P-loop ATPase, Sll1717 family [Flammeovirgaceae bacterium]
MFSFKNNLGDFIAEHEKENLYDYFIETFQYDSLIKSEHNIVIGRKGTGKTATFYYLRNELGKDTRNHVCVIKPINFEIDGLIELYKGLTTDFETGFMTEAIWKFLIYTEIGKSIYNKIKDKPVYAITEAELRFIQYIEQNKEIFLPDFSSRLEQELERLKQHPTSLNQQNFKIRISEILHDSILIEVKNHLKNLLSKNRQLIVLIDNLDKSWRAGGDINVLSKFLLGLLGIVGRISRDLKGKPQEKIEFSFHLVLFLRSDIFKYLMLNAREPDKIEYARLRWNDSQVLFRVIESRFKKLSGLKTDSQDLWADYIVSAIKGTSIREWVSENVLPRPRDIIYLFNVAKDFAISRGHSKIETDDIISSHKDYSSWVFKSIIVENGITIGQMENFLYQLMGEPIIISNADIESYMKLAGIPASKLHEFIDHLVSLSLIGRETSPGRFEYEFEFDGDKKLKTLANKLGTNRFRIHNAFASYLESKMS